MLTSLLNVYFLKAASNSFVLFNCFLPFPYYCAYIYRLLFGRSVMSDSLQTHQALRPWDFPGKKYWSRLPFPSPAYTHTDTHTHIGQQSFHWKNILQICSPPCTLPFHSPNDIFWGSELNISIVLFINPWLQVISPFQPQWTLAAPQLCWIPPLVFTCDLHTSATRYNVSSMRAQSMPAVINSLGHKQYLVHNRYPRKIFFLLNEWKNKLWIYFIFLTTLCAFTIWLLKSFFNFKNFCLLCLSIHFFIFSYALHIFSFLKNYI